MFETIERVVLGPGPRYTPPEIFERTGTPEATARQLWVAMGFPHVPPGEAVLTERDEHALKEAQSLVAAGFELPLVIRQARVMSHAMATVAAAQVEALGAGSEGDVGGAVTALAGGGESLLESFVGLLAYLYRRHLVAALERGAALGTEGAQEVSLAVGFADLSGFTSASSQAGVDELAALVERFEATAADIVAECGGRVIKLIGDEVLFTVDDPLAAADAVLQVVEAAGRIEKGLPVHAGVAMGPVLQHLGDVFGPTVNRASRLTDAARPGSVLVDGAFRDSLADHGRFSLKRVHPRPLKGLGTVRPYVLKRAATTPAPHPGAPPSRTRREVTEVTPENE